MKNNKNTERAAGFAWDMSSGCAEGRALWAHVHWCPRTRGMLVAAALTGWVGMRGRARDLRLAAGVGGTAGADGAGYGWLHGAVAALVAGDALAGVRIDHGAGFTDPAAAAGGGEDQ